MSNYHLYQHVLVWLRLIVSSKTRNEWCNVISHNPIIPALMTHYFGGDPEGIFGATPFEVLHQLSLCLLKYILDSLYNYLTIPKDWESFFKKRICQEVPNRYSEANETGLPPVDLTYPDQPSSRKRAKRTNATITSTDIRTNFQKYQHCQKLQPHMF